MLPAAPPGAEPAAATEPQITAGAEQPIEAQLAPGSDLHQKVLAKINSRIDLSKRIIGQRYKAMNRVDEKMRMYMNLTDPAVKGDGTIDTTKKEMPFQRSVVIPASYAVHEVRKTQLLSIAMNREPFMQLEGRGPEDVRRAKLLEAVLSYDAQLMQIKPILWSLFQDADKYGFGVIYDVWEDELGWVKTPPPIMALPIPPMLYPAVAKFLPSLFAVGKKWGTRRSFCKWANVDPYTYYPDPRVPISKPQEGEFVGHQSKRGFTYLLEHSKETSEDGVYFNLEEAKKHPSTGRQEGPGRSSAFTADLTLKEGPDAEDPGYFELDHLQVKIVPRDWQLGESDFPEIWWFTVANKTTIIRAHPSPYDHGEFTYAVAETNHDPHVIFNPGTIENAEGLQRLIDWFFNSRAENIRKALNDQFVYDPTAIEEEDLLNPGPMSHIRLSQEGQRRAREGVPINQMLSQFAVSDLTGAHFDMANYAFDMMQRMTAASDPSQGVQTKERRTLGEVQSILAASSQRVATLYQIIDALCFTPLAYRSVANRQQFTSEEQYFRIAGDLAKEMGAQGDRIPVGPLDIQGNFDYVPHTGALPADPARDAELWIKMLELGGQFAAVPGIGVPNPVDGKALDFREVYAEAFRRAGVKDVERFFSVMGVMTPMLGGGPPQVMPDEMVAAGVQQGNLAPMPPVA